jgi:hypothetical protein
VTARHADGTFATESLEAVYAEIKRLDQLREADQRAAIAARIADKEATAVALTASKEAVSKAEGAQANVNATQNEFRGLVNDQQATLMPRAEAENTTRELRGLLADLTAQVGGLRSRLDIGPPSLGALQTQSDQDRGRAAQALDTRTLILAIVGLALTAAMLFSALHR